MLVLRSSQDLQVYALAAGYIALTFLVRVVVLLLTLPLFALAAFIAFLDGIVQRDILWRRARIGLRLPPRPRPDFPARAAALGRLSVLSDQHPSPVDLTTECSASRDCYPHHRSDVQEVSLTRMALS